jgi:hypothetical protein
LANGSAIRVHEFPPHELDRNRDGYRTMTNQWVCTTSSSEHSFVRDLGMLSQGITWIDEPTVELMKRAGETAGTDWKTGDNILKWIDAYAGASGNSRSCWVGEKKKIVCMTWEPTSLRGCGTVGRAQMIGFNIQLRWSKLCSVEVRVFPRGFDSDRGIRS